MSEMDQNKQMEKERRNSLLTQLQSMQIMQVIFIFISFLILALCRLSTSEIELPIVALCGFVLSICALAVTIVGQWRSLNPNPNEDTTEQIRKSNHSRSALILASMITTFTCFVVECVAVIWSIIVTL